MAGFDSSWLAKQKHLIGPQLEPLFRAVVTDGRTIACPEDLDSEQAQQLWMPSPTHRTVSAADDDNNIVGTHTTQGRQFPS